MGQAALSELPGAHAMAQMIEDAPLQFEEIHYGKDLFLAAIEGY